MDRGNTGVPLSLVLINSHSAQRLERHVGNGILICRVKGKVGVMMYKKKNTKYSTALSTGTFANRVPDIA